jgi:hypothetical protein
MIEAIKDFAKDDFGKTVLTIAGTLLVTSFGVLLGAFKDIFTDHWKRRRLTKYNAMLLATTLDQLISDCLDVIFDPQCEDQQGISQATAPTPKIEWPAQLEWSLIPTELMYRCLLIPASIKRANESTSFVYNVIAGPPDYSEYFEERDDCYSQIGLAAVHILNRLNESYGVERQERLHRDPQQVFTSTLKRIAESREEQRAAQRLR